MIKQKLTITITKMISITNSSRIFRCVMLLYSSYYTCAHDATAVQIINKYIADIQTNMMTADKPLEFWLNSCPKAYSQLSVLAVDLLAAPASQAFVDVERLFSANA